MGRILSIDYGRKRVGIAVTDPGQMIANGLETVRSIDTIDFLRAYFDQEDVDLVVIGYPKQMNNTPSESVVYVNDFITDFKKAFPGKDYFLMDERFTSKMAFSDHDRRRSKKAKKKRQSIN